MKKILFLIPLLLISCGKSEVVKTTDPSTSVQGQNIEVNDSRDSSSGKTLEILPSTPVGPSGSGITDERGNPIATSDSAIGKVSFNQNDYVFRVMG